jgi:hypothetical protein
MIRVVLVVALLALGAASAHAWLIQGSGSPPPTTCTPAAVVSSSASDIAAVVGASASDVTAIVCP